MKKLLVFVAFITWTGSALAQDAVKVVKPDALTWRDAPGIPKGAQTATVFGDPTKPGELYVSRLKLPPNYQLPPHTHSYEMNIITVMSGSLGYAHGDKFEKKGEMLQPGAVLVHAGKIAHYFWTGNEETIIQIQGVAPGAGIAYVNPTDDPRK